MITKTKLSIVAILLAFAVAGLIFVKAWPILCPSEHVDGQNVIAQSKRIVPLKVYDFELVRIIDGDTIIVDVDLGFDLKLVDRRIRLSDIDAIERSHPKHTEAVAFVANWLKNENVVLVTTGQSDKYGRTLATFESNGTTLNDALVEADFAVYRKY